MITSYPDKNSLKEVLSSELSTTALKNICKKNGIFFLSNKKEDVVNAAHLLYWGFSDINKLSELMEDCKNYKKSFRLQIGTKYAELTNDTNQLFQNFLSLISTYRNGVALQKGYEFQSFIIDNSGGNNHLKATVEYKKRRKGRVKLLDVVPQRFSFDACADSDGIIVDVVFDDRADVQIAKAIITDALATSEDFNVPKQISLFSLTTAERVDLFDQFFSFRFANWMVEAVKNIKVELSTDIDTDEDEEAEDTVENNFLTGIQSALLSGSGLRTNPIVVDAVNRGYFFPKATVMFTHRTEAQKLLLDINFSGDELALELSIVTTYEIEDDRAYKQPLDVVEQEVALQYFHSVLSEIFSGIIAKRNS